MTEHVLVVNSPTSFMRVKLPADVCFIGSDRTCEVCIYGPGIAPLHAELKLWNGGYTIERLSSGAVSLGPRMLLTGHPEPWGPGKPVRLGSVVLITLEPLLVF